MLFRKTSTRYRRIEPATLGLDPPLEGCWTFGVRMGWRILNLQLCVSNAPPNPNTLIDSAPSFSVHSWKKGCCRSCVADLPWYLHTLDFFQTSQETPIGTRFSMSSRHSPLGRRWIGWTNLTARARHDTSDLLQTLRSSSRRQSPRYWRMGRAT